jgi:hypothetical protein
MIGHSCRSNPNADHSAKPITVIVYIHPEITAGYPT